MKTPEFIVFISFPDLDFQFTASDADISGKMKKKVKNVDPIMAHTIY